MITGIICNCSANPDIDGYYDRKFIEEACEYLSKPKTDWMKYLLGNIFIDCPEWTVEIENVFLNDAVMNMTVDLGENGVVEIKKLEEY